MENSIGNLNQTLCNQSEYLSQGPSESISSENHHISERVPQHLQTNQPAGNRSLDIINQTSPPVSGENSPAEQTIDEKITQLVTEINEKIRDPSRNITNFSSFLTLGTGGEGLVERRG